MVAISWCTMGLFIPSFLVSAMTVSAAARASAKLTESLNGSSRRFSQPASPPVSPCKSNKSFGSAYGECLLDSCSAPRDQGGRELRGRVAALLPGLFLSMGLPHTCRQLMLAALCPPIPTPTAPGL